MNATLPLPAVMVSRLSAYRRGLRTWLSAGRQRIFSHELAGLANASPAQVRRDLMTIGYTGSPARGYDVAGLVGWITDLLDPPSVDPTVLVGLGYLGRAVLRFMATAHPEYPIVAAFDVNPDKVDRVLDGCRCHDMAALDAVVREKRAGLGIVTVPPESAQIVVDQLTAAGVRGILNFTTVQVRVPAQAFVEDIDISLSLEKVAYFARGSRTSGDSAL